ncbi:MAG: endonuclease/exonuclease/phosphatase family protein, partial [Rikenellaceae bacterium]|nr:endonuclease/exonuclease/phosphatase family protein [Rikenellaceae bacterium]
GTIEGEPFCFFVCHWPSRRGGQAASEFKRVGAAQTVRHAADSILKLRPQTKIVVMGDLNDDPVDKSIYEALGAKDEMDKMAPGGYYNPFWEMFKKGYGTLAYNDAWNLFDNIIVGYNLVDPKAGGLKIVRSESSKYYGNIFDRQFLKQQSGQYENYPLRTFVGNAFQGGYSDHFPVYILMSK